MDRTDALGLVNKIEQTWPGKWPGARIDVWIDFLTPLEMGPAGTTWAKLRGSHPHAPTPAEFQQVYNSLHTRDAADRPRKCVDCGYEDANGMVHNTGWITCTSHPDHRGHWRGREHMRPVLQTPTGPEPSECMCNIVRPCPTCARNSASDSL